MNRRSFLGGLAALVGGVVLEQAIPFGRVWSFPKNIVIAKPKQVGVGAILALMMEQIRPHLPNLYERDDELMKLIAGRKPVLVGGDKWRLPLAT